VQESGPYNLLGWSHGGVLAHEIAVRLQAAGEQVASLTIMDAYPPQEGDRDPVIRKIGPVEEADPSANQAQPETTSGPEDELALIAGMIRRELGFMIFSDEELMIFARVYQNNTEIMRSHEFGMFDGNLLLISAAEGRPENYTADLWRPYVSGEIVESALPCAHENMGQPGVLAQVWDRISRWLGLDG